MSINWKSIGAGLVSVLGILAQHTDQLPKNVGIGIAIVGFLGQLFTHPAVAPKS